MSDTITYDINMTLFTIRLVNMSDISFQILLILGTELEQLEQLCHIHIPVNSNIGK